MNQTTLDLNPVGLRLAEMSPDGLYRYVLRRRWASARILMMILLNASTADAVQNDPTVRRCIYFALNYGFGGLDLFNLFALRATDPKVMLRAEDPIGLLNDSYIADAAQEHAMVCLAWGNHGCHRNRDRAVLDILSRASPRPSLWCFGKTKGGHPKHPLYLPKSTKMVSYMLPGNSVDSVGGSGKVPGPRGLPSHLPGGIQ